MASHYEKAKDAAVYDLVAVVATILAENDNVSGPRSALLPSEWRAPLVDAMNELDKFKS